MRYPNSKLKIVVILSITSILLSWNINIIPQNSINTYEVKNDLEEMNLKGKVKSIKETSFFLIYENGEVINSRIERENNSEKDKLILFNIDGNITIDKEYDSNKNLTSKVIYKYDNNGHKTESILYDSNGNIISKSIYKNDINGNKTEVINYNPNNSINNRVTYEYNDRGNKIKDEMYLQENNKYGLFTYKYDNIGCLIEYGLYLRDANKLEDSNLYLESLEIYKNDVDGNRIEAISYDSNNELRDKTTFQYDTNGNETEINQFGPNGTQIYFEYLQYGYDDQNNWEIKIKPSDSNNNRYLIKRVFEYYK